MQNHLEITSKVVLDPKCAKLNQQLYKNFTEFLLIDYAPFCKFIFTKIIVFELQTTFCDCFHVLLSFLDKNDTERI